MNIIFLILSILLLPFTILSQSNQGKIIYQQTLQLQLEEDQLAQIPAEMRALLPTQHSSSYQLLFHPKASLYQATPSQKENNAYEYEEEDLVIDVQTASSEEQYYNNLQQQQSLESKQLFGKHFLIQHSSVLKWKISQEQQEIAGYACQKATSTTSDGKLIEAWFTNSIPVAVGPSGFHGLPGAVLLVKVEQGKQQWLATVVELTPIDTQQLKAPKKGKKVTAEEFKAIALAKREELKEAYGGSGNMIIKTTTIDQ